jgi:phosphoserine/homoserine phosphotransferase
LKRARERMQVIVLSDSFIEISKSIIEKLENPTIFSHNILIENDNIVDYKLRISDQKTKSVQKFKELNFTTIAV